MLAHATDGLRLSLLVSALWKILTEKFNLFSIPITCSCQKGNGNISAVGTVRMFIEIRTIMGSFCPTLAQREVSEITTSEELSCNRMYPFLSLQFNSLKSLR